MNLPPPPPHLSPSAAEWWSLTVARYVLEEHHLRLLTLACESWDRCEQARQRLEAEGLTVQGREGLKPHPCAAIERESRLAFARLVRELDLDTEAPRPGSNSPPAIFSNRGRHARKAS
jgi:phage terminase small subunit